MDGERPSFRTFRERLVARSKLIGTFVKTPTTHATEILGEVGYDFVVFDQEHAPLDAGVLDMMILGARASNVASIVRVPAADPALIQTALDCGATGVMVPHVSSPETARLIARACRYMGGTRGFANTTRAGGFGSVGFAEHKANQDRQVTCIAMIEDVEAVDRIDEILKVEGLDAIFIGRGDLTAALNAPSMNSPETMRIVEPIMAAARAANVPMVMLCPDRADAERMAELGASAFMVQSDHGFMRQAAAAALAQLRSL
ncbi:aldolase/citrate lyase family protein [Chelativorans sp. SCAU2101]|uniref:Aldolase/citrate lyase family protein n=1 Tax=Chelativorans petroleitrophicus TaxID=2975484 RepID=A0A9X2X4K7_9HYPH|nr:aldolase/citrate lyase family protein [Chelativorans petroleitrophicus]MCT8988692.1 aldolase/citrate lyase family protein [Chelativorans petroleitrophicus]